MTVKYKERLRRIRARYPKAYERWSEGDDNLLKQEYKVGVGIEELSQLLQRQPSAIKSRLRKLDLSTGNKGQKKADASICVGFSFEWQTVLQDSGKEYSFPGQITNFMKRLYRRPAIYRWNLWGNDQAHPRPIYIGSTKQLCPDRLKRYLNPRTSRTNIRLNERFNKYLRQGFEVKLDILHTNKVVVGDIVLTSYDLSANHTRLAIESLLITYYRQKGFKLLNL